VFQKILIATHNKAKLAEIKFGLLDIEKKGEVIYLLRKFRETLPEGVKLVLNE